MWKTCWYGINSVCLWISALWDHGHLLCLLFPCTVNKVEVWRLGLPSLCSTFLPSHQQTHRDTPWEGPGKVSLHSLVFSYLFSILSISFKISAYEKKHHEGHLACFRLSLAQLTLRFLTKGILAMSGHILGYYNRIRDMPLASSGWRWEMLLNFPQSKRLPHHQQRFIQSKCQMSICS